MYAARKGVAVDAGALLQLELRHFLCDDLVNDFWTPLQTITATAEESMLTDPSAGSANYRCYRITWLP